MTANTFRIHQCTVSKTIVEVCRAINLHLGPTYLSLPKDVDEMRRKVSEFKLSFGMTQTFGCIDGTHIPIKRPQVIHRIQFFSLSIQAVCHSKGHFMDVARINGLSQCTMQKFFFKFYHEQ